MAVAVGVDVGTSSMKVSVYDVQSGALREELSIPAYLAWDGEEVFFGEDAQTRSQAAPEQTLFAMKMFLGLDRNGTQTVSQRYRYPFVVPDRREPCFILTVGDAKETATAVVALTEHFKDILKQVMAKYQQNSVRLTLTYPSWTGQYEQESLFDAAVRAGWQSVHLRSSVECAVFYASAREMLKGPGVLVVDFGASLLELQFWKLTSGQPHTAPPSYLDYVCGNEIDRRLLLKCAGMFAEQFKLDPLTNPKATERLRFACQEAKEKLSIAKNFTLDVPNLLGNHSFRYALSREMLEDLCGTVWIDLGRRIGEYLMAQRMVCADITDVLLIGSGAKIPAVQKMVRWATGVAPNEAVLSHASDISALGAGLFSLPQFYQAYPVLVKRADAEVVKNAAVSAPASAAKGTSHPLEPQEGKLQAEKSVKAVSAGDGSKRDERPVTTCPGKDPEAADIVLEVPSSTTKASSAHSGDADRQVCSVKSTKSEGQAAAGSAKQKTVASNSSYADTVASKAQLKPRNDDGTRPTSSMPAIEASKTAGQCSVNHGCDNGGKGSSGAVKRSMQQPENLRGTGSGSTTVLRNMLSSQAEQERQSRAQSTAGRTVTAPTPAVRPLSSSESLAAVAQGIVTPHQQRANLAMPLMVSARMRPSRTWNECLLTTEPGILNLIPLTLTGTGDDILNVTIDGTMRAENEKVDDMIVCHLKKNGRPFCTMTVSVERTEALVENLKTAFQMSA